MTKVRGPKNGKVVTASFDGKEKSLFPSLKTTRDLVLLSIKGNEYCIGEYLGAIINQAVATHQTNPDISAANGKATFLIADEIYWHNLKNISPTREEESALKKEALSLGDSYFTSNLSYFVAPLGITTDDFNLKYVDKSVDEKIDIINKLASAQGKNFEIVRWHAWVDQDKSNQLNEMRPLYDSVEGLRVTIDEAVNDFAKRHNKNEGSLDLWNYRSRGYLTEESPSIMWLAASLGYNFIIYPGNILSPFTATKEFFVVENHIARILKGESIKEECTHSKFCIHVQEPSRLVNWLEVNFKRSNPAIISSHSPIPHAPTPTPTPKGRELTFFCSPKKVLLKIIASADDMTSERMDTRDGGTLMSPRKNILLSSLIEGVGKALANEYTLRKEKSPHLKFSSSQLSEIFKGITQGVLETNLPDADKLGFLVELVNTYVNTSAAPDALDADMGKILTMM